MEISGGTLPDISLVSKVVLTDNLDSLVNNQGLPANPDFILQEVNNMEGMSQDILPVIRFDISQVQHFLRECQQILVIDVMPENTLLIQVDITRIVRASTTLLEGKPSTSETDNRRFYPFITSLRLLHSSRGDFFICLMDYKLGISLWYDFISCICNMCRNKK